METKHGFGFIGAVSLSLLCLLALLCAPSPVHGSRSSKLRNHDQSQEWGYVQVRPKAHLFWWLYRSPNRVDDPKKPWPIVLWLQGGPGASGVGIGNFQEIGPLDTNLKPRNSTWLRVADLLFVDNPVGTGYSFVEEADLVVKSDEEAANDLTTLLGKVFNGDPTLRKRPLYLVAESYGGRYAVTTALSALKAIEAGKLNLTLGGIAIGDSWISPEDFVFSWGPLLKDLSRLDDNGMQRANRLAEKIKQQISDQKYTDATNSWAALEGEISASSNSVDFYNFMLDSANDPLGTSSADPISTTAGKISSKRFTMSRYSSGIPTPGDVVDLGSLMNGAIKKQLKIPENVTWGGQGDLVFTGLQEDFMKPRINEVDQLLAKGVHVTVYNGQVDLICSTKGAEAWVQKLKWEGASNFQSMDRTPLFCNQEGSTTKGFKKSYKNLHFYWILGAGHFVPVDQPCIALSMLANITGSPAKL